MEAEFYTKLENVKKKPFAILSTNQITNNGSVCSPIELTFEVKLKISERINENNNTYQFQILSLIKM